MFGKILFGLSLASFLTAFPLNEYTKEKIDKPDTTVIVQLTDEYGEDAETRHEVQNAFYKELGVALKYNYTKEGSVDLIGNYVFINICEEDFEIVQSLDLVESVWYNVTYDTAQYKEEENFTINLGTNENTILKPNSFNPQNETTAPDHNYSRDTMNAPSLDDPDYYQGDGTVIAVLDNGFEINHPSFAELSSNIDIRYSSDDITQIVQENGLSGRANYNNKIIYMRDYTGSGDNDVFNPTENHGIHVASIASANGEWTGIAPNAQVALMKVFPDGVGGASDTDIYKALNDCMALDVDVINMSLGSPIYEYPSDRNNEINGESSSSFAIFRKLVEKGISVSISAGNEGRASFMSSNAYGHSNTNYGPYGEGYSIDNVDSGIIGSYAGSIYGTIVASGRVDGDTTITNDNAIYLRYVSSFSSDGPTYDMHLNPDIITPGENVWGASNTHTDADGDYVYMDGTSMAAPNYSGAYANILSNGDWQDIADETQKETSRNEYRKTLKARIQSTADPYKPSDHPNTSINSTYISPRKQGAGLVNIVDAIATSVYFKGVDNTTNQALVNESAEIELGNDTNIANGIFDFTVTGINEGDTTRNYSATLYVQAPSIATNTTNDVTTEYASLFDETIDTYTFDVTLNPGENDIDVNYTLDEEAKEYLETFTEGTYIEGYLVFTPTDSADSIELSMPFLGFYGDYSQAAPVEEFDFAKDPQSTMLSGGEMVNMAYSARGGANADFRSLIATRENPFTDNELLAAANGTSLLRNANEAVIDNDTGALIVGVDGLSSNIAIQLLVYRNIASNSIALINSDGDTVYNSGFRSMGNSNYTTSAGGILWKSLILNETNGLSTSFGYATITFRNTANELIYPEGEYTLRFTFNLIYGSTVTREYKIEVRDTVSHNPIISSPVITNNSETNEAEKLRINLEDDAETILVSDGFRYPTYEILEDESGKYVELLLTDFTQRDKIYLQVTNTYNLVNSMLIIPSLLDNGVYVTNQYLSESYKIDFELTEGQVSNNSFTNRYNVSIVDSRGNIVNEVTSFEVGIKVPTNAQIPTDLNSVGDYFTVNQISFTGAASPVEFTYENGFLKVNTTTGIIEVTYQYNANSEPTNPENPTPSEGIPAWGWALIGVGIVVVIGGAAGLTYYLIRKKNK